MKSRQSLHCILQYDSIYYSKAIHFILELGMVRINQSRMGSSIYLKLSNGRMVPLRSSADKRAALAIKEHLDRWVNDGQTLSVANAQGQIEDITPRSVEAIEIIDEP